MRRGVRWYLVGSVVVLTLGTLVALVGCSGQWIAEREPWRHEAEVACLNSGAVKEGSAKVRISPINGPGMCGADFPFKVAALGDGAALGYSDEPLRPPGSIPGASLPPRWPATETTREPYPPLEARPLPPLAAPPYDRGYGRQTSPHFGSPPPPGPYGSSPQSPYGASPPYPAQPAARNAPRYEPLAPRSEPAYGPPISLTPPGLPESYPDEPDVRPEVPQFSNPDLAPRQPAARGAPYRTPPAQPQTVPLGPARGPSVTGSAGPVEVKPAATLACPVVAALDRWIAEAVQPAAWRWFGQPVVELKQISAYSCRGMNGNSRSRISEHAFGNALDIASFELADGRKVSVQHGWGGQPEEQGFLRDVQAAACAHFSTVLAPGSNIYHYNHIHVDLMRRSGGRRVCDPAAVSGEVVAERARARYASQRGDPGVTGSIKSRSRQRPLGYTGENDGRLPLAIPGED
jgi:hypothetical protein